MALVKDEKGRKVRIASSAHAFRKDYRKHVLISYREAADYAGVSIKTVRNWISDRPGGPLLSLARRFGAYRIDIRVLDEFLRRRRKK